MIKKSQPKQTDGRKDHRATFPLCKTGSFGTADVKGVTDLVSIRGRARGLIRQLHRGGGWPNFEALPSFRLGNYLSERVTLRFQ